MTIRDLDHVQVAIPEGEEERARDFYGGILGLRELPKPASLARRGGVWFAVGSRQLHLGVDVDFRPATKAHPAFRVRDLARLVERCRRANVPVMDDEPLAGCVRVYLADPFGNRIELLQPLSGDEDRERLNGCRRRRAGGRGVGR
ncbi:MAG TPA: VOC family protein [Thermoanaerobaculia bacterium]|nr:VOC family protein [Thermoanaerobaculia bacterium]